MHKRFLPFIALLLCCCFVLECCGTPPAKKYSPDLVRTYAELLVLHEKEKLAGSTPDSLYAMRVKDFFAARKINEDEFQRRIGEISRNDIAWRAFLNDATVATDSIKAAKPL